MKKISILFSMVLIMALCFCMVPTTNTYASSNTATVTKTHSLSTGSPIRDPGSGQYYFMTSTGTFGFDLGDIISVTGVTVNGVNTYVTSKSTNSYCAYARSLSSSGSLTLTVRIVYEPTYTVRRTHDQDLVGGYWSEVFDMDAFGSMPETYTFTLGTIVDVEPVGYTVVTDFDYNSYTCYVDRPYDWEPAYFDTATVDITYKISFTASSQDVSCTINPSFATNKGVTWTVYWSYGENISSYLTLTVVDSNTVRVNNIKDLAGKTAYLKCTSNENSSIYATCTIRG